MIRKMLMVQRSRQVQNSRLPIVKQKPVGHTVRVDIEKLDVLMNLVSELIIAKNGLVSASSEELREH